MENVTTYVGIDAHKKDLFIAMLVGQEKTPVTWTVPNEPSAIRRLVRKLERDAAGPVRACYEAGPCGYALQRRLTTPRVSCQVIAPALIPRKPGERIKTNPRDARKLVELLRADLLTEVHPPTPEDEAVRDLCRARDDAGRFAAVSPSIGQATLAPRLALHCRSTLDAGASPLDRESGMDPRGRTLGRGRLSAGD